MPKKTKKSFEDELERVQEIVGELEEGPASLDEMLALFEEGVAATKRLEKVLADAETRVQLLQRDEEGELKLRDEDAEE